MTISSISKNKYTEDINACRTLKFLSKKLHYGVFNNYGMLDITSYPNSFLGDLKHMVMVVFDKYSKQMDYERLAKRFLRKNFVTFSIGVSAISKNRLQNGLKAFTIGGRMYRNGHIKRIEGVEGI